MKFKNFRELSKNDFGFAIKIFLIVVACSTACYFSYLNSSWPILLLAGIIGIINYIGYACSFYCNYSMKYMKRHSLLYIVICYAIMALVPIAFTWKTLIIFAITILFKVFRLFISSFLWGKQGFSSLKEYVRELSWKRKDEYLDLGAIVYFFITITLCLYFFNVGYKNDPEYVAKVAKKEAEKIELIKKDVIKKISSHKSSPDGIYKILREGQHVMIVDTVLTVNLNGNTYYTFISKDNKIAEGHHHISPEMLFTRKGHKITFKCSEYGAIQTFDNLNVILVKDY